MKGWPTRQLGDFVTKKRGSVEPAKFPDEIFDLYSIPAFDEGQPEVRAGSEIGSAKQVVESSDVLLSRIVPHIRRAWVVGANRGRRQIASGEWIVFRSPQLHPRFLRYFLAGDPFHGRFMQTVAGVGGSLLRAKATEVAKIEFPLPPLAEQERIVKLLDEADALRKLRTQADRRTADLIPALFHEMFGDPVSNSLSWQQAPLGTFLEFLTSGSRGWAKYYSDTGAPFLRIQNVGDNALLLDDLTFVTPPDNAEANRTRVRSGDVLVSITADLGRTAAIPHDFPLAYINQHLALLRLRDLDPTFVAATLSSDGAKSKWLNLNRAAVKSGLNFDDIRSFPMVIPPLPLQREFARRVAEIRELQSAQAANRQRTEALFQSTLHRAFNGEL